MVYIKIPYKTANEAIDRQTIIDGISALDISEDTKYNTFEAIYNAEPDGVALDDNKPDEILLIERFLRRYRIGYHISK